MVGVGSARTGTPIYIVVARDVGVCDFPLGSYTERHDYQSVD
jgi:hypothetical protein